MARNVILGQLLVAGLLNDTFSSCVFHLRKLLDIFLANGFDKAEVSRVVIRYLANVDLSELQPAYNLFEAWHAACR
jgi:hypothetical protein